MKPKPEGLGGASRGSSELAHGSLEAPSSSEAEVEWKIVDRKKKKKIRIAKWRPCTITEEHGKKKKEEVKSLEERWPEGLAKVTQEEWQ